MTEIVLPPNHITTLFRYLRPLAPAGSLVSEEPDSGDYDASKVLIILRDGGQSGPLSYTFWDCLTTVEVRAAARTEALEVARKVDGLLRAITVPDIHYLSSLGNPAFMVDDERRIPTYSWTVQHRMRGESVQVEDINLR